MTGLTAGALMALALIQQTDTVFPVSGATRIAVESPGGSITVTAWNRAEVRVQAEHSSRSVVDIDRRGTTIDIEAEARRGPANIVDYRIWAPAGMDLDLEGMYTQITVEGMDGEVEAETLQGDVTIRGGRGSVKAQSVQGEVLIDGAQGSVEVETVSRGVRVLNASGEIMIESVSGPITLENVRATRLDVGTVSGRVTFTGSLAPVGDYFFGAHNGSVVLRLTGEINATFHVATIQGGIRSDLPGSPDRFERGQRQAFSVGAGEASVEIETFNGSIVITRSESR